MRSIIFLIFSTLVIYILSIYTYNRNDSLISLILYLVSILFIPLYIVKIPKLKLFQSFITNLKGKSKILNDKWSILLISIIAISIAFRFWNLTSIPILTHDEAKDTGLFPQMILSGQLKDYFGFYAGINNFFFLVAAIPHLFFSDPILKVRFFSALFGVLSVLLIYYFAYKTFSKKVALLAAFFLSVYHVHIHFSRTEFLNLFDSFYAIIILISFFFYKKFQSLYSVIMLAVILGFGLHFYTGLRALTLIAIIVFFIHNFKKYHYKKAIISAFIFLFFFIIALGPMAIVIKDRPQEATHGTAILVTKGSNDLYSVIGKISENYKDSIMAYMATPINFHYNYGGPFLIFPFSLFFVIGFLFIIFKRRSSIVNYLIVSSILFIPFFNSAILKEINYTHRLMSLVPFIILLLAMGVNVTAEIINKFSRKISFLFIITLSIAFFAYNFNLYFLNNAWEKALFINEFRAWEAQKIVNREDKTESVIYFLGNDIFPSFKSVPPLDYLTQGYNIVDVNSEQQINNIYSRKNYILLIMPGNFAGIDKDKLISQGFFYENVYYKNIYLFDTAILKN